MCPDSKITFRESGLEHQVVDLQQSTFQEAQNQYHWMHRYISGDKMCAEPLWYKWVIENIILHQLGYIE